MTLNQTLRSTAAAIMLIASASTGAIAQQVYAPVDPVGPGGGGGCASGQVFGAYTVTICSNGSYTVTGGGLNCNGSFNYNNFGSGVRINLHRSQCGAGTDWSGDTIRCGGSAPNGNILISTIRNNSCSYQPTAEARANGYTAQGINFN